MCKGRRHQIGILLLSFLLSGSFAYSQTTSLTLASGSGAQGGSVPLNLSLSASAGQAPAALQWTLAYAPGDIVSVNLATGAALTAAGKTLNCVAQAGSVACLASGMNGNSIGNGVVAVVTVTLSASSSSTVPISILNPVGAVADGSATAVSGIGSAISVQNSLPVVSQVQCSPASLTSGTSSVCTVTLSKAAPAGGAMIAISDNSAALAVPASVTVAAGSLSATFSATAGTIASDQSATVTATYTGSSANAAIGLVAPVLVSSLACNPTTLAPNASSTCTVTLSKAAPTGGASVTLTNTNTTLTVPASVTVAATATTATFSATTTAIPSNQSATVTATYNGSSATATITLSASVLVSSLACSPTTLGPNASSTCTVTLSKATPTGGASVVLTNTNTTLTVPASVTVAAAATTATFNATTTTIPSNQSATVTATYNGSSATATITLSASTLVSSLSCSPTTLGPNASSTCTVTLSKAAPTGGGTIAISDNSAALTVPASITVASGAMTATFSATTTTVSSNQSAIVTATYNGSSATATITLSASVLVSSLSCSPTTLGPNASSTCTVTLSKAAPTGGGTIAISDNSAALTVPASITVASGATTASFNATTTTVSSNQSAIVTATYNGSSATATITLSASTLVSSLSCSPATLAPNGSSTCSVTLSKAASTGGAFVTLTDTSSTLTIPASVTVAAGSTSANFSATTGSFSTDQSVTVTAAFNGSSATASLTLQTATTTVPTGLVAAYSLDAGSGTTITDASGHGITGTIHGATWTTTSKFGKALSFNGTNNYVDLGNPASLQITGSMTWSAWIMATANPADDGQILAKGWEFKTSPDTGPHTFGVAVAGRGSLTQRYSKTVRALNTWYYVASVYNASARTLDIYVNGVLDNGVLSGTVPAAQARSSLNVNIGRRFGGYYFKGVIDEVRIYGRALSQAEIQRDMTAAISTYSAAPASQTVTAPATAAIRVQKPGSASSPDSATATAAQPRHAVSSLSCTPGTVSAGGQTTCELRVTPSPTPFELRLTSTSSQVKTPAVVYARPNQSSLTFQATVEPAAKQQSAAVSATLGDSQVADTIQVTPASGPVLTVPDKQIARFGSAVRFTVGAVDPADMPLQLAAARVPAGASFDPASGQFTWVPTAAQAGKYEIAFAATNSARQTSTAQVTIEVDSGTPVTDSDLLACSPNAIAALTGRWLAESDSILSDPTAGSMDLGGTRVKVNGRYVPVLAASAMDVKFLCPVLEAGTPLAVVVETAAGATEPLNSTMREASPRILPLDGSARKQGLVSFAGTADLVMERNPGVLAHPAQPGDAILIWATGLGSAAESSSGTVLVRFGDVYTQADAVHAVAGHAGVYTVQVRVPAGLAFGDAVPVELQVTVSDGRQLSSPGVTAGIEPVRQ